MPRRRRFSEDPFGTTLERLMTETGVTYRALASQTKLSAGYLNHLVHGNRPVPSNDIVGKLADALGVDPRRDRVTRARPAGRAATQRRQGPDLRTRRVLTP